MQSGRNPVSANGEPGQRYVVMRDTSTTGEVQQSSTAQMPTSLAITAHLRSKLSGSGEIPELAKAAGHVVATSATAAFSDGCAKVLVLPSRISTGPAVGTTTTLRRGTGSQYASYVPVRAAATAAASAESVTLRDVYDYQSKLTGMVGHSVVLRWYPRRHRAVESYHYTAGNQHYSAYGH